MNAPVEVTERDRDRAPVNSEKKSGETPKRGRGRPKGAQPKDRPEIPDDLFTIVAVSREERGNFKRRREERSEKQIAVDNQVMAIYKEWVKLGKPRVWAQMNVKDWPLPPNLVETATFLLGKAAALHGLKLYYGQKNVIEDGIYHLTFCVVEKRIKVEGAPEDEKDA